MDTPERLKGKHLLIVDDEPDVLETLEELLDDCRIDSAPDFETAKKFLDKNDYDVAILDIMGVRGYDLLELTKEKGIPALMLTAHALSPDNLVQSIESGADAYVPKEKIAEIDTFVAEVLEARETGQQQGGSWFARLKPYFDKKFGPGWRKKHIPFWQRFDEKYVPKRDDAEKMM